MSASASVTAGERRALATLGGAALAGFLALAWLNRPVPLRIAEADAAVPRPEWDRALALSGHVRLNTATQEELERLPRIGPALARRILEARQARGGFSNLQELLAVQGIGPKLLEDLAPRLTLE